MKIFQIGFNKCGTKFLTQLFQLNGLATAHWERGELARNIYSAKINGCSPLTPWGDVAFFSDMECVHNTNEPMIEAFKEFEYLDSCFPEAKFILNIRNVDDWIVSRFMHEDGAYAMHHATHRGVSPAELADIWYAEWESHLLKCRRYFSSRSDMIEIDIDNFKPEDYERALSPWVKIRKLPRLPGVKTRRAKAASYRKVLEILESGPGFAKER